MLHSIWLLLCCLCTFGNAYANMVTALEKQIKNQLEGKDIVSVSAFISQQQLIDDFQVRDLVLDNAYFHATVFDKQKKTNINIQGRYKAIIRVPVLKYDIKRGQIIRRNDLVMGNKQLTRIRGSYLDNIQDIINQEAKRYLRSNDIVRKADIDSPTLVGRNQYVTLVYRNNLIELKMKAKALDSGKLHDLIRVENLKTKKIIPATVINSNTALIQ